METQQCPVQLVNIVNCKSELFTAGPLGPRPGAFFKASQNESFRAEDTQHNIFGPESQTLEKVKSKGSYGTQRELADAERGSSSELDRCALAASRNSLKTRTHAFPEYEETRDERRGGALRVLFDRSLESFCGPRGRKGCASLTNQRQCFQLRWVCGRG